MHKLKPKLVMDWKMGHFFLMVYWFSICFANVPIFTTELTIAAKMTAKKK